MPDSTHFSLELGTTFWQSVIKKEERKLYVDSHLLGSDLPGRIHRVEATNAHVGLANGDQYFHGEIDELAIWKKALNSEEVLMLYNHSSCDIGSDPNICISTCDGSMYIPDHSVWDFDHLPSFQKHYAPQIQVKQMVWDYQLKMCFDHVVWPPTEPTHALLFPSGPASYVLNVPISYGVHGVYTMALWAKYTGDYNGDNVMVNTDWWTVPSANNAGFLGSTQAGWPQQPDIWEHIHVEFDTGNFAPTHMRWYVGKRGNYGNLGSIFVSDLSVSGPKGPYTCSVILQW